MMWMMIKRIMKSDYHDHDVNEITIMMSMIVRPMEQDDIISGC